MPLICAIDQGTTGTTVILLNEKLEIKARVNQEFRQIYPKPSWVEHDPEDIWASTLATIKSACEQAGDTDIAAIGITNQRETTVVWDRKTGKAIHNAIVWQDRRTAGVIRQLKDEANESWIQKKTGLMLDPYFSGTKVAWILDHVEGARERAERGELAFGTIDTYLLWRLTEGQTHKTDVSNASRTLLMDLEKAEWDPELLKVFRVPASLLPEICGNAQEFGKARGVPGITDGTPIAGIAGDQQAALFGQACFDAGEAKCTYGTGAFLLMNTGTKPVPSVHRLLTTAAWRLNGKTTYALEGSAFIAGAMVQWLRDGIGLIKSAAEIEELARSVESSDGVVAVPALSGLGAPHWQPDARGVIWGLTRGTTRAHIARAALEGIALQNVDILRAMENDLGKPLVELKVDGGASANNLLMQMQSDFLGRKIVRPEMTDTTALGAALLAGLGVGLYTSLDDIRANWKVDQVFESAITEAEREAHLRRWNQAVQRV
ncbi:glycerol kinase GlpK [Microvenator marinus]|uniref:Glycerol kinase n=1 Tax=Microvenator marinus TaxID=2600177 RepID=A0A5B8XT63_9DELT|nr:glycerol kinase GlpK [Microvenator marinus]QED28058.1 glycerol kinase GlpK [Microvenator marinus]